MRMYICVCVCYIDRKVCVYMWVCVCRYISAYKRAQNMEITIVVMTTVRAVIGNEEHIVVCVDSVYTKISTVASTKTKRCLKTKQTLNHFFF